MFVCFVCLFQLEEKRRHEEELELQRLRREAVPKAQPVKHYRPVDVKPSDKPLTLPSAPKFSTLSREKRPTENVGINETFDM